MSGGGYLYIYSCPDEHAEFSECIEVETDAEGGFDGFALFDVPEFFNVSVCIAIFVAVLALKFGVWVGRKQ